MNDFNEIGKRMPYVESEEYLDDVLKKSTDAAIDARRPITAKHRFRWIAAAMVVLAIGIGITYIAKMNRQQIPVAPAESGLDYYLDQMSDDDALLIEYYEIDDIPEYE